jgi:probable rRNA maturation factor
VSNNEITIAIEYSGEGVPDRTWFEDKAERILNSVHTEEPVELSIVITGNDEIQQLNHMYKGKDEPTDVLSFAMIDEGNMNGPEGFIVPPDGIKHLGEIIISYPKAVEQSGELGHDVLRELVILLIHGILHLFGYDHESDEDAAVMQQNESEIINSIYTV